MPYNPSIPGQVSEFQLQAIEAVARLVPPQGKVVEVGSLFGSSSWAWAKSVDPSVTVFCIDPWDRNDGVRNIEARLGIKYGIEQFRAYTADCPNIRPLQGYSPANFLDWSDPIDLYYEDAVHVDPILDQNLSFWSGKLKPGGIVCGDDFRPRFPDVRRGARRLAEAFGRDLLRVDFFWCLLPDEKHLAGSAAVAEELRELGLRSDAQKRLRGPIFSAGPRRPVESQPPGISRVVGCRLANDGIDTWPPVGTPDGGSELVAGLRVVAEEAPGRVVAESRVAIGVSQLEPDLPIDFDIVLPLGALKPGRYRLIFDVVRPDGSWTIHPKIEAASASKVEVSASAARSPAEMEEHGASGPAYALGSTILFNTGGTSEDYTRDGWILPEKNHRWMSLEASRLVLPVAPPAEALRAGSKVRMKMTATPFVAPGKIDRQSLSVSVNGESVFEGMLSEKSTVEVDIPADVFFRDTPASIAFFHPDGRRPADVLEGSRDVKVLSFAVSDMTFTLDNG